MKKRYIYLIIVFILLLSLLIYILNVPKLKKIDELNSKEVRVVTYNLDNLKSTDKLVNQIKEIDPDLIGFQGLINETKEDLIAELDGYDYTNSSSNSDGNTIFYKKEKFDLLDSGNIWYTNTPNIESIGYDAETYRYATWVELKDKKSNLNFYHYNTQFESDHNQSKTKSFEILMKELLNLDESVVLTGNFMFFEGEHSYNDFTDYKLSDSKYKTVDNVSYSTINFGFNLNYSLIKPLDFIFVSDETILVNNYRIDNSEIVSNHFPVIADIEIK